MPPVYDGSSVGPFRGRAPREEGFRGRSFGERGGRGGRGGRDTRAPKYIKPVDSEYEDVDVTELDKHVAKIYSDLIRLEPVRRALFANKSLDMMFIIDCTGSMSSWIDASKKEIKSIIDCVRNQHFNIQIRVSIVAYRDHCDGELISEVFKFSNDIA